MFSKTRSECIPEGSGAASLLLTVWQKSSPPRTLTILNVGATLT